MYRVQIPYTKIYGSILAFVEKPTNSRDSNGDVYGHFIRHLEKNPHERDCLELYMNLFARLFKSLKDQNRVYMDPDTQEAFQEMFREHFYKHVTSEPKFTLSLSDFTAQDYKSFKFPIEVNLFPDVNRMSKIISEEGKSPELMVIERKIITVVEKFMKDLDAGTMIEECIERGIPTTYEEVKALHILNGGSEDDWVTYTPFQHVLERAYIKEAYKEALKQNSEV